MRNLTTTEIDLVSGGILDVSAGTVNALNGISFANGNSVLSGNCVQANGNGSGNLSGNTVDVASTVTGTVSAALGSLGL